MQAFHQAVWAKCTVTKRAVRPSTAHLRLWRAGIRPQGRNRDGHAGRRAQRVPQRQRHLCQRRALGARLRSHACAEQREPHCLACVWLAQRLINAKCLQADARRLANLHA